MPSRAGDPPPREPRTAALFPGARGSKQQLERAGHRCSRPHMPCRRASHDKDFPAWPALAQAPQRTPRPFAARALASGTYKGPQGAARPFSRLLSVTEPAGVRLSTQAESLGSLAFDLNATRSLPEAPSPRIPCSSTAVREVPKAIGQHRRPLH
ncbi:hypothetical protein SMALB_3505 [Streptomyces malaysiensis]|uniref:Uncharacterized protein n=1 Tax=Streptomyces malaysiensis TaxID=92644 RepID=A0A7X5X2T6_STRMQ|nr:hypothetical protein [Streptomyces malaysiensis]